ncbi:sugar ABC transporter substrate-binding protein [Nocardioides hwasunensis]|uniref:Sugar ABC transporter substrate-binding protein n=1 Tax=Nocardioides hwasunensis TaxID=397258 RepID=A0ABR8MLB8_9ACTN|nr:sugar ABC transporter substrate-binding protein [Nocardioides hwasunensis]MBD3915585.1 sugar ABC transporter substrate-binding protein [Nocardioides hwasunensis]
MPASRRHHPGALRSTLSAACVLAVGLAVSGCTKSADGPGGTAAPAAPVVSAAAGADKICGDYKDKTIGVVHLTTADENESTLVTALKEASDAAGLKWTFKEADSQGSAEKSQQAVSTFVNQGVDAILLLVVSTRDLQPQLEDAQAAGIPVFGQWSFSELDPLLVQDYTPIPAADASALAQEMFSSLYLQQPEGDIEVALVNTDLDILGARNAAVRGLATLYPRIKIVDSANIDFTDIAGSTQRIVGGFMSKYPDLDAVWANYPVAGPAAAQSILAAGKDIQVFTHVAQSEGINALQDPENPLTAMPWLDFDFQSYHTVEGMLTHFAGEEPGRLEGYENPVPFRVFTKKTADELTGAGVAAGIGWTSQDGQWKQPLVDGWGAEFPC